MQGYNCVKPGFSNADCGKKGIVDTVYSLVLFKSVKPPVKVRDSPGKHEAVIATGVEIPSISPTPFIVVCAHPFKKIVIVALPVIAVTQPAGDVFTL